MLGTTRSILPQRPEKLPSLARIMICHRRMGCEESRGHRELVSVSDIPSHEQVMAEFHVARLNGQPMPHRRHSLIPRSR
jgi:hypothetical protein